MPQARTALTRAAVIVLPALVGVAAIAWFVANREGLPKTQVEEVVQPVPVVEARRLKVRPQARGFGSVRAARTWAAVADVEGRVQAEHPDLDAGAVIRKGATLLRIDPEDYELAIAETQARIDALKAQLAELDTRRSNLESSIAIQRRAVDLARQSFERAKTLSQRGAVPESTRDSREEQYLAQRRQLQDLKNETNLIPSERRRLEASVAELKARLGRQQSDLAATKITAPFTLRLAEVNVEVDQQVTRGQRLLSGDGVTAAEVPAEVPLDQLRAVLRSAGIGANRDVATLNEQLRGNNVPAVIRLRGAQADASWQGSLVRIGDGLNARTRTVSAVVRVDAPYAKGAYPLFKNMYVQADLLGRHEQRIVVPRAALHDGRVYAVDADERLAIRPVEVAYRLDGAVALASGIDAGTQVVLGDVVPAADGLRLRAVQDDEAQTRMARAAQPHGAGAEPRP